MAAEPDPCWPLRGLFQQLHRWAPFYSAHARPFPCFSDMLFHVDAKNMLCMTITGVDGLFHVTPVVSLVTRENPYEIFCLEVTSLRWPLKFAHVRKDCTSVLALVQELRTQALSIHVDKPVHHGS